MCVCVCVCVCVWWHGGQISLALVICNVVQNWLILSARTGRKEWEAFLKLNLPQHHSLADGMTPFFILECSGHQSIFIFSLSVLTAVFWSVICRGMSSFRIALFSHWKSQCCDPSNSGSLYTYLKPIFHEKLWCCRIILTVARQDINGHCCLSLNRFQNTPWIKWRICTGLENSKQRDQQQ